MIMPMIESFRFLVILTYTIGVWSDRRAGGHVFNGVTKLVEVAVIGVEGVRLPEQGPL